MVRSSVWVAGRGWVRWLGRGWVRCLGRGWVVAEVGCWSSQIASVWVRRGHGEIGVGHGDGFGGDRRGSPHGWLVLLGSAFPMGIFFIFILIWVLFWWDFGGQWAVVAWWAWWRCDGGDWAVEAR